MLGEVVALKAEWTDPKLCSKVNYGEGVEDRAAHAATEGGIRKNRNGRIWLYRSKNGGNRDHTVSSILLCAWYNIPCHSYPILGLKVQKL